VTLTSETKVPAGLYPQRIDTHHHVYPPRYVAEELDRIAGVGPGFPVSMITDWTPAVSIADMDRNGVSAAVVSIGTPGVWHGDNEKAASLARHCNEYCAQLIRDYPGRFGAFATLPLPDIDASLREIEYATETLGLDGFGLLTNIDGRWPGDKSFAPIYDELNRRKAVVYYHPKTPDRFTDVLPDVPDAIMEFLFDTTRAIVSLLYSGTLARCPDIRFIFSHGGGTLPYLSDRIASLSRRATAKEIAARVPNGVEYELKKLYYDAVSTANNPQAFGALSGLVPASNILLGSDFPYWSVERTIGGLNAAKLSAADRSAIEFGNAAALFPRLAERIASRSGSMKG